MPAALILIDIQTGFDAAFWGARNNPGAEANATRLLAQWRNRDHPLCHVRHVSTEPGSPLSPATGGTAFKPDVTPDPGEEVFDKSVNSAFIGTRLEAHLQELGVREVVICGLTTPHCVSSSVRMAANLGFDVTLAHDACAAFARNADTGWRGGLPAYTPEAIHDAAISQLHGEFCTARATSAILAGPR